MLEPDKEKKNWLSRLKTGLQLSSSKLTQGISEVFTQRRLNDDMLEQLEEILITSDLGPHVASRLVKEFAHGRFGKDITYQEVKKALADQITHLIEPYARPLVIDRSHKPYVVLVVGVNGTGKTTTIGKLAESYHKEGLTITLAAGDTFRAAAISQLKVWGERTQSTVVAGESGSDAAALVFQAFEKAQHDGTDLLLVDTAGRLHNKNDLMQELAKIVRVIKKIDPSAPHAVLLVLDATTGQNAHAQVNVFREITNVTGLIVTKLDGSAKGGILVPLVDQFKLPIHAIGVGESVEDLQPFRADEFARSLMGLDTI